jgi:hypothetical protein
VGQVPASTVQPDTISIAGRCSGTASSRSAPQHRPCATTQPHPCIHKVTLKHYCHAHALKRYCTYVAATPLRTFLAAQLPECSL